jgi:hypothetical protein
LRRTLLRQKKIHRLKVLISLNEYNLTIIFTNIRRAMRCQVQRRENSQTFFGVENPNAPIIPQDLFTHIALFAFPNTPEGDSDFLKHALSNEELKIRYKGRFNTLVNKFFLHVVHGEKAKAEAMVQKTPGLFIPKC